MGKVFSINISARKGVSKLPVKEAKLIEGFGIEGDGHSGKGIRQVSFLSIESIRRQKICSKIKKAPYALKPGDFAENITTEDIDLTNSSIGDCFIIGTSVKVKVTKIGKECHRYCAVYYKIGDCIFPREGIFAEVIKGGVIRTGDKIKIEKDN